MRTCETPLWSTVRCRSKQPWALVDNKINPPLHSPRLPSDVTIAVAEIYDH